MQVSLICNRPSIENKQKFAGGDDQVCPGGMADLSCGLHIHIPTGPFYFSRIKQIKLVNELQVSTLNIVVELLAGTCDQWANGHYNADNDMNAW